MYVEARRDRAGVHAFWIMTGAKLGVAGYTLETTSRAKAVSRNPLCVCRCHSRGDDVFRWAVVVWETRYGLRDDGEPRRAEPRAGTGGGWYEECILRTNE